MSSRRIAILSFLAGIIVLGSCLLLVQVWRGFFVPAPSPVVDSEILPATPTELVAEQWTTYQNDIFGFSIEHPASWKVAESNKDGTPMISIYKPGRAIQYSGVAVPLPPFAHWNNATHVSVYPSGIPTEGVVGVTRASTLLFAVPVKQARDYLTVPAGTDPLDTTALVSRAWPWATFVDFEDTPTNWKPWGFVWAGVAIPQMDIFCFRNGEHIAVDSCDPLAGDEIVHVGMPDPADRAVEERMLKSLRFAD